MGSFFNDKTRFQRFRQSVLPRPPGSPVPSSKSRQSGPVRLSVLFSHSVMSVSPISHVPSRQSVPSVRPPGRQAVPSGQSVASVSPVRLTFLSRQWGPVRPSVMSRQSSHVSHSVGPASQSVISRPYSEHLGLFFRRGVPIGPVPSRQSVISRPSDSPVPSGQSVPSVRQSCPVSQPGMSHKLVRHAPSVSQIPSRKSPLSCPAS